MNEIKLGKYKHYKGKETENLFLALNTLINYNKK